MTTLRLTLLGSLSENQNLVEPPNLPKHIIIHDEPDEVVTIGRENSKTKVNYVLGDSSKPRVVSRLHATLKYNSDDGSFVLIDHSVNGTYVNYTRVPVNGVKLEMEDIVCFFHRNGANIKPGEKVEPFDTHLKYRVELIDEDEEDNVDDNEDEDIDDNISKTSKEPNNRNSKKRRYSERSNSLDPVKKSRVKTKSIPNKNKGIRVSANRRNTKSNSNVKMQLAQDEEEVCAAEICMRPIGLAIDWIQCDHCASWYHQMCLGISSSKAIDPSKPYFCPTCRK